jgi:hypothetical protein
MGKDRCGQESTGELLSLFPSCLTRLKQDTPATSILASQHVTDQITDQPGSSQIQF